ncbi:MAG: patatin-like phospholipase family protein [Mariprofundaceae bacterium]
MAFWQNLLSAKAKQGFVLALGGGGSRGLAHLGVLEVLEQHHLKPDAIVGTSIGALFGTMYALNPNILEVRERVDHFLQSDAFIDLNLPSFDKGGATNMTWLSRLELAAKQTILFTRAAKDIAVVDTNVLHKITKKLCDAADFSEVKIPLYITAVEFPSGECHMFSKGDLPLAVTASMALPGVFDPVEIDGSRYVDGGIASELPAKEGKMVSAIDQAVVAVNVGSRPDPKKIPKNVIAMLDWTTQVKALYLRQYKKEFADVLIEPLVGFRQWHDFSDPEQEIQCGRDAALEKMPDLLKILGA